MSPQADRGVALPPDANELPAIAAGQSTGLVAAEAREKAMVFVAAELAWRNQRNEQAAMERVERSCAVPAFAEKAEYRFPRSSKGKRVEITGPSVHLAREIARCWGNIRYGFEIVASGESRFRIIGWAWDLNPGNNVYAVAPDEFSLMHQRTDRETGEVEWIEVDERDARELLNRRGAMCERNAILKLLPPHVVAAAIDATRKTRSLDSEKRLKADKVGTIANVRKAFAKLDVTVAMLERKLGHKLEEISSEELDELRDIRTSIEDGQSKVSDHFSREDKPEPADGETPQQVSDMFKGEPKPANGGKQEPPAKDAKK